ncbi:UDP-galactose transporter senju-like isoform X2 [Watersipora subatra]|uniref:UDP-galactose transporter senju-like isoform X2 n=1 Tax=Watersipora subatra TaxID=2589382 RepID=UPI00355C1F4D
MALFINQGILVKATNKEGGGYNYNPTIAVFITEWVKITAAVILYIKDAGLSQLLPEIVKHYRVCLFYFVPAGLYCAYNNLGFVNLKHFDPTTYFLLLQFRVVVTGIIFQLLFKKKLSHMQWMSLVILTLGCILKEVGHTQQAVTASLSSASSNGFFSQMLNVHLLLIMVQVFASCFAGVYNEFLLKDTGAEVHVMIQNIFMYIDSIICGLLLLLYQSPAKVFTTQEFSKVLGSPGVMVVVLNNAAIGIVTSLFLRSLNSILKTFASALELMFTAVLCWFIFGIAVDVYTVVSIGIVSAATFLYAQNPVVNKGKLDEEEAKQSPAAAPAVNSKSSMV